VTHLRKLTLDEIARYLGCYTHRVAISNHRLVALEDRVVVFRWRDSAHKNKKRLMRPSTTQFKTHNAAVPNRLTSSRSIENAPALRFRALTRTSSRRSVSDTALGLNGSYPARLPDRPQRPAGDFLEPDFLGV
jgi:hypothetical protein